MLDLEQYDRKVADTGHRLVPDAKTYSSGTEALANLSDEDIMLCCHSLPGFSLELKIWGSFSVNKIKEVAYNDLAFQGLVLPEKKKMLISSLLELQDNQIEDTFDDLIQGKGKGLVFLLHGPPGVGKTYTAGSYRSSNIELWQCKINTKRSVREHRGPYTSAIAQTKLC